MIGIKHLSHLEIARQYLDEAFIKSINSLQSLWVSERKGIRPQPHHISMLSM